MKKKAAKKENLPVPTKHIPKKDADYHCNSRKRKKNEYCKLRAGYGTEHVGQGRCKFHGGLSQSKHGVYSKIIPVKFHDILENVKPEDITSLDHEQLRLKTLLIELTESWEKEIEIELDENGDPKQDKFSHLTIQDKLDYTIKIIAVTGKNASTIEANRERAAKRQDHRQELLKFITPLVSVFYEEFDIIIKDMRINREALPRAHKERMEKRTVWN